MKAIDYCVRVFDGTHDTPKPTEKGYKLITSKNILNRTLNLDDAYYISESDYISINKRSKVKQWDILFSMIGTVGNVYLEQNKDITYAIKNMGVFSCEDENKALWLYYYLQSPYFKQYLNSYLSGAVQKFVPLDFLRNIEVPNCTEETIRKCSVLSTLDRKISLNRSINLELEQMAKDIYDYWFVQFEFPDEHGRPYKSSGGAMVYNPVLKREVPQGWEVVSIEKKCKCLLGGTPSRNKNEYWNGEINWINSGKVNDFRITIPSEKITELGLKNTSTYILPKNTTVLAITGATLGQVSILAIDSCANQSVVGILENEEIHTEYIYPYVINDLTRLINQQTGAAQPHVSKADIENIPLLVPPKCILDKYYLKVKPTFDSIMSNALQIDELTSLRDKLLPLLMTGQVKIK